MQGCRVDLLSPGRSPGVVRAIAPNMHRVSVADRGELLAYLSRSRSSYDCWMLIGRWCWEVAVPSDLPWRRVFLVADQATPVRVGREALRLLRDLQLLCPTAKVLRGARAVWGRAREERIVGWGVDVPATPPRRREDKLGLIGSTEWKQHVRMIVSREMLGRPESSAMVAVASGNERDLLTVLGRGSVAFVPEEWEEGKLICLQSGGGLYFGDTEELAREVRRLSSDRALLRGMSSAAHSYAARLGSWDAVSAAVGTAVRGTTASYPLVYIIIINWNGKRHLATCLSSLRKLNYPNFKALIVDNGSTDGSLKFLRDHFPEVEVVPVGRNLGFAEGNNVGLRLALRKGARYVALLNNDTEVDHRWLSRLVERAERGSNVGIVGSKMMMFRERKVLNSAGSSMNRCGFGWDDGIFKLDAPEWNKPRYCLCVTAGAMLVRREVLEEVGLFDAGYFAYYEDNDLCLRARNSGYLIAYEPSAVVYHKLSGTSGEASQWKTFLMERSRYRIVLKKYPGRVFRELLPTLLRYDLREAKDWLNAREYPRIRAQIGALVGALLMLPGILARRRTEGPLRDDIWDEVKDELGRPTIRKENAHLGSLRLMSRLIPSGRILMGVNDCFLEGAWPAVIRDFPRYRPVEGTLRCRLPVSVKGPAMLQLHLYAEPGHDCRVFVTLGGVELDERMVHPGWNTYVWDVGQGTEAPELTLEAEGAVRVNEILLSSPDPARLRRP
jgi:GT2 family glycosyltransferase